MVHEAVLPHLAWAHRDPFDRMLVAQAQLEDVPSSAAMACSIRAEMSEV
jgi:PIN domain nuclease of toxin-antitoxin system